MPDPLNTPDSPQPSPAPRSPKTVTCGFCGTRLTPEGDALKLSEEAKGYRDAAEIIDAGKKKIRELEGTIETLRLEIETLKRVPDAPPDTPPAPEPRRGLYL